jgi:hypothetical protein
VNQSRIYECVFGGSIPAIMYDWCDALVEQLPGLHIAFDDDRLFVSGRTADYVAESMAKYYGAVVFPYEFKHTDEIVSQSAG